ncbi:MAG: GspMb/PilO family protein [Candidatus Gracilibacteria bacterium]|jgi:Tfp pilus assembly protein PilO
MFDKLQTQQTQVESSPKKKSQAHTLFGVLLVLIAVSLYAVLMKPLSATVDQNAQDLSMKNAEVDSLNLKIDDFKKKEADFKLSDEKKRQILSAIPIGMKEDEVIRDIVAIAVANDVTLKSVSFSRSSLNEYNVNVLRISASFEGSYEELVNFLKEVEGNKRRFNVNSISVQVNPSDLSLSKRVSFSLTMDSFYGK